MLTFEMSFSGYKPSSPRNTKMYWILTLLFNKHKLTFSEYILFTELKIRIYITNKILEIINK